MLHDSRAGACPATPAQRVGRAVIAVTLGVAAAATAGYLGWLAVVLALGAAGAGFGAVTGSCPTDFLRRHRRPSEPPRNTLGLPEARGHIDIDRS